MPTETLTLVPTGTSKRNTTSILDTAHSTSWPREFRDILLQAGWQELGILKPYWLVNVVFMLFMTDRILTLPLIPGACSARKTFMTVEGTGYRFYDPAHELPVACSDADPNTKGGVWVKEGVDVNSSIGNLAGKISD